MTQQYEYQSRSFKSFLGAQDDLSKRSPFMQGAQGVLQVALKQLDRLVSTMEITIVVVLVVPVAIALVVALGAVAFIALVAAVSIGAISILLMITICAPIHMACKKMSGSPNVGFISSWKTLAASLWHLADSFWHAISTMPEGVMKIPKILCLIILAPISVSLMVSLSVLGALICAVALLLMCVTALICSPVALVAGIEKVVADTAQKTSTKDIANNVSKATGNTIASGLIVSEQLSNDNNYANVHNYLHQ